LSLIPPFPINFRTPNFFFIWSICLGVGVDITGTSALPGRFPFPSFCLHRSESIFPSHTEKGLFSFLPTKSSISLPPLTSLPNLPSHFPCALHRGQGVFANILFGMLLPLPKRKASLFRPDSVQLMIFFLLKPFFSSLPAVGENPFRTRRQLQWVS